jgi:hypothetical protein
LKDGRFDEKSFEIEIRHELKIAIKNIVKEADCEIQR